MEESPSCRRLNRQTRHHPSARWGRDFDHRAGHDLEKFVGNLGGRTRFEKSANRLPPPRRLPDQPKMTERRKAALLLTVNMMEPGRHGARRQPGHRDQIPG